MTQFMKKQRDNIAIITSIKDNLKTYDCVGFGGYAMVKNRHFLITKINNTLDAYIKGDKSEYISALYTLKSYSYLLYNKAKKEALNGLNIIY